MLKEKREKGVEGWRRQKREKRRGVRNTEGKRMERESLDVEYGGGRTDGLWEVEERARET